MHLTDDRIKHHMMVAGGCRAVPTDNTAMIDMGELVDPEDPDLDEE